MHNVDIYCMIISETMTLVLLDNAIVSILNAISQSLYNGILF